jgi:transketolase
MRKAFIKTLEKLAEKDKDIYLLTGDLGFSVFENFAKKFPERFINCGLIEQTMMGIASGLALEGKKPYVYSIVPFATMRCFEQIRNDVCYPNLNIKIIGIGTGFSYGPHGFTHYGIEDISILSSLPNLVLLSPANSLETKELVLKSYENKKPTYIRLDKSGSKTKIEKKEIFISKPIVYKNGKDIALITAGTCLEDAISVANLAKKNGLSLKVINMHTLKPVNEKFLLKQIENIKTIITLEEHSLINGLGSLVNRILIKNKIKNKNVQNLGIKDNFENITGSRSFLKDYHKIDKNNVYKIILNFLQ